MISLQAGVVGEDEVEVTGSRTPEVINASQTTNDGIPGRWHFRVDCRKASDCIGLLCSYYFSQHLLFFEHVYILKLELC